MAVFFALVWLLTSPAPDPVCDLEFTQPRSVIESSSPVHELWGVAGINAYTSLSGTNLVATEKIVIVTDIRCSQIVALDWASGETMWITPVGEIQPQNIVLDSARNRVYVSGTRSVWALATEDGQILWSNGSERFVRNAHHVYVREDGQVMVALFDDLYIDPATGHLSSSPIQLDSDGYDNAPMLDMQSIRMFPAVQSNTVSSNFASVGNTLYFMDSNARLHFLDLNSGEEMETVQFEPPEETPLLMQSGSIGGSWLSVDGNRIAIYFQDSDQLSAYKINAS